MIAIWTSNHILHHIACFRLITICTYGWAETALLTNRSQRVAYNHNIMRLNRYMLWVSNVPSIRTFFNFIIFLPELKPHPQIDEYHAQTHTFIVRNVNRYENGTKRNKNPKTHKTKNGKKWQKTWQTNEKRREARDPFDAIRKVCPNEKSPRCRAFSCSYWMNMDNGALFDVFLTKKRDQNWKPLNILRNVQKSALNVPLIWWRSVEIFDVLLFSKRK